MSKPVDTLVAANAVIRFAKAAELDITHLKLQKILYFAYAIYLIEQDDRLFDAEFEAWQYGPVVRELYSELKSFGSSRLIEPIAVVDPATGLPLTDHNAIDEKRLAFLHRITCFYGRLSSSQLVNKSHAKGGPWDVTVREAERQLNVGMVITDDTIRQCYRAQWLGAHISVVNQEEDGTNYDKDAPFAERGFR